VKETVANPELHKVLISFLPTLRALCSLETKLVNELTRQLEWHPRAVLRVSLPGGRKIYFLSLLVVFQVIPEELPWNVRIQIEKLTMSNKVTGDDLLRIKDLVRNPRWVSGRLPQVLKRALAETQLYILQEPDRVRPKVRRRGHPESSQISLEERPELRARRAVAESSFDELPKRAQIYESQRVQLARADLILKKEALGEPIPTSAEWNADRSYEEQKFSEAFWPTEPQEILVHDDEENSDAYKSFSKHEKDISRCQNCKYAPKGSLRCAAGSLACDGGRKPIR